MGYPIVLDLRERSVTVVGGGTVATRKIEGLLNAGAWVTVITPSATETIKQWASDGRLQLIERGYAAGDTTGAALVFAATDSAPTNAQVTSEAQAEGRWVNVADESARGDFTLPAVATFDALQLAIDTGGGGPALARAVKQHLEQAIVPGWGRGASVFQALRPLVRPLGTEAQRRTFWRALSGELPQAAEGTFEEMVTWVESGLAGSKLSLDREQVQETLKKAMERYETLSRELNQE